MNIDKVLREEIKQNLRNSIRKYVTNFRYRSSQPLDLLIPRERKIRSVVGGLETSMGTTVWEPIAKTLAQINGFEIIEEKILMPKPFPKILAIELSTLISLRENANTWIPTAECVQRLKEARNAIKGQEIGYVSPAAGTGVDIRLKKNGIEYAFDTKTVKPNVGGIKGFNKELLEWYAYRICKDPDVTIQCKIAYPYNPYSDDFWKHTPHNAGMLEPKVDALVGNEFWDFLSGKDHTLQEIFSMLKELSDEGFGQELSSLIENLHIVPAP